MALSLRAGAMSRDFASPFRLGIDFQVPGEVWRPRPGGVRAWRFEEDGNALRISITLPAEPEGDPEEELRDLLRKAVVVAEDYAKEKGIADELPGLHAWMNEL